MVEQHIPALQKPSVTMRMLMNYSRGPRARGGNGDGEGGLASVAVVVSESTPSVSHHITHINAHRNTSAHTLIHTPVHIHWVSDAPHRGAVPLDTMTSVCCATSHTLSANNESTLSVAYCQNYIYICGQV